MTRRPFGVSVLVLLCILAGLANALAAATGILALTQPSALEALTAIEVYDWVSIAVGTLFIVAAVGLWQLRYWGWVLTILLTGSQLATSLWQLLAVGRDDVSSTAMLVGIVAVFYLNQRDVQACFGQNAPGRLSE